MQLLGQLLVRLIKKNNINIKRNTNKNKIININKKSITYYYVY